MQEKKKIDWGQASVDGLNKTVGESIARDEIRKNSKKISWWGKIMNWLKEI